MATTSPSELTIREQITPGNVAPAASETPGVAIRVFVSRRCGATGISTGTATFERAAELLYHEHDCSEAVTILSGEANVVGDGRSYELRELDCIHIPAGVPHSVRNQSSILPMLAHWAFATPEPSRRFVEVRPVRAVRGLGKPEAADPEHISRFHEAEIYELSPGALFRDLFKGSLGAVGICGGYGRFQPGSSLPCHFHEYDESITIVEGTALCLVQGSGCQVSGYGTAFVPVGKPHRFMNESNADMAMIWVYAGSEPERTLVEPEYCAGTLTWPGPAAFRKN
ncbi:MAG: cupin domain-containing protein [Bryobacteraceae bacterium]